MPELLPTLIAALMFVFSVGFLAVATVRSVRNWAGVNKMERREARAEVLAPEGRVRPKAAHCDRPSQARDQRAAALQAAALEERRRAGHQHSVRDWGAAGTSARLRLGQDGRHAVC